MRWLTMDWMIEEIDRVRGIGLVDILLDDAVEAFRQRIVCIAYGQ